MLITKRAEVLSMLGIEDDYGIWTCIEISHPEGIIKTKLLKSIADRFELVVGKHVDVSICPSNTKNIKATAAKLLSGKSELSIKVKFIKEV